MEQYEKQSYVPERLEVGCCGNPGFNEEPWSLVRDDLMKRKYLEDILYKEKIAHYKLSHAGHSSYICYNCFSINGVHTISAIYS